ncbi:hypothetical protein [Paenisporosarcina indica]|uniref:hypothetical protein n=1 Tax=Paenisporosarcina indica TaxID=650093 RepID=UPI000A3EDEEC|nr:hypothetical protein [Paenisporosarcina indica]
MQKEFIDLLNPTLELERNLDIILVKTHEYVKAPNFRFYLYDSSQKQYVLKAVRQLTNDTHIAPSYSGLLPYDKQAMSFPLKYPAESFPSETLVVKEGGVKKVLVPIYDKGGFVVIGPIKKITKKEIKKLNEVGILLQLPLKEVVKNAEKSRETYTDLQTNDRKERMLFTNNFGLYYGYGQVEKLSRFDLIIVDPKGFTLPQFQQLKKPKKVIFTYLSLFEVHPTDPIFSKLNEEDLLCVGGKPLMNKDFGTYLVNFQSKKWMEHLLENVRHQFETLGADGLFLDTIGDIECPSIPIQIKRMQLHAILNFLHVLKMLYPTHLIIQNNGLESVCLETAPYIDGICWENPPLSLPESKEWTDLMIQRLTLLKNEFQLKVFLLLEETTEKERKSYSLAKTVATERDFLLYHALGNYVGTVNDV